MTVKTKDVAIVEEIPIGDMKATAGSEENSDQGKDLATNVLDGNLGTIWHSKWAGDARENLYLTIELDVYKRQGTMGIELWKAS